MDRRAMLVLLLIGWAMALILLNMLDTLEQTARCEKFGICPGVYHPASEESHRVSPNNR